MYKTYSAMGTNLKRDITASMIVYEEEFCLCRLKTLKQWKVAVFYNEIESEFTQTFKRVLMEVSKWDID